jgi:Zn-finger nucleic acid-binding protein
MQTSRAEDTAYDRCLDCGGVWLDALEVDRESVRRNARVIDVGDPETGRAMDRNVRVACPRCGGRMVHVRHAQRDVGFEQCGVCGGAFFDAGELRDLAAPRWLAWLRGR